MKFFSVDSPLYKFMNRLMDVFKLNCMWLLCSLPIVTMGAATTAAYTITLKMVEDEEGYIAGPFWKEFKANLKKGSILGVIGMVASYAVYLDFQLYHAAKHHKILVPASTKDFCKSINLSSFSRIHSSGHTPGFIPTFWRFEPVAPSKITGFCCIMV